MVPRLFTIETWLAHLLGQWVRKGNAPKVALVEDGTALGIQLEREEKGIALVRTADGREYVFTSHRAIEDGATVFRYVEVVGCHWITDHPDPMERARLKRTHSRRMILDLGNGRRIVMEQLGQAVFPLLRFIRSILPTSGVSA